MHYEIYNKFFLSKERRIMETYANIKVKSVVPPGRDFSYASTGCPAMTVKFHNFMN
jgi:hypothetical protein